MNLSSEDVTEGGSRRRRSGFHRLLVATTLLSGLFVIGIGNSSGILMPTPAAAATSCASKAATAHFKTAVTTTGTLGQLTQVSSVKLDGFATACDGRTAKLLLLGNPTGSNAATATLISTATSTLDPCTQKKLSSPPTITSGSITLGLCPTPATASSYVVVHDLTELSLSVSTVPVPVKITPVTSPTQGSSTAGSSSGTGSTRVSTAASSSGLAFTGADIAAMTGGGLLIILLGLFLLLISRRRRRSQATGDAAP